MNLVGAAAERNTKNATGQTNMNSFLYRSPKTEVRHSIIAGSGLFAKANIKKGELISLKSGSIVEESTLDKLDPICQDYWFQIRDGYYISPLTKQEAIDTALYINHSCDPNVGVDGDIGLVAIRDIKMGDELCYDYAMDTTKADFLLNCKCGSTVCRKIITGNDWKRKDLQERYGFHFAWYIVKRIKGWD
jgi:uncharacterized protein